VVRTRTGLKEPRFRFAEVRERTRTGPSLDRFAFADVCELEGTAPPASPTSLLAASHHAAIPSTSPLATPLKRATSYSMKGGPHIILDYDGAPSPTSHLPPLLHRRPTTATAATPPLAPAPFITTSHPRRTASDDDDPSHTVSGPLHAAVNMAHAADPEDSWSNKGAMARLVKRGPKGGTLRADRGGDSDETPVLVAKPSSLRAVQVMATEFNLEAYKTDIKVAYLNQDKRKYISAAHWSTSARRTLDLSAHPPSLTYIHTCRLPYARFRFVYIEML